LQTKLEMRKKRFFVSATEGELLKGIPPWREIITPHKDVAEGLYQKAEFAADLAQVYRGSGSREYSDPEEFFRRTFLTDGLRHLIKGAVQRLSGKSGEPVIELQTNFGGGKTHSMLALFHLCSGLPSNKLLGIQDIFKDAGVEKLPAIRKSVLVGTDLNPAKVSKKDDGTETHTLWGEMAWQLAGSEGYEFVKEADVKGVGPGADSLTSLFKMCGPSLVLIDEWVAFVRQLYNSKGDLPAGDFEANLTFAQSLTEAVKRSPNTLLVASVPASDIEVGGEAGFEALKRLQNVFTRVQSPWKPATTEEGFEIVRRRLFQTVDDPKKSAQIDAVAREFSKWYRANSHEFPSEASEGEYERRMKASYPIHPEVFERLYEDWGTLDRFQRTRGVLRLMASAIFDLWMRDDRSAMILPGMIPLDSEAVRDQLLYFLPPAWSPVVESNVDGKNSVPIEIDTKNPNLAKYSATRRVSRAIFMGSAPTVGTAKPGIDEKNIKLGCVQPGENAAIFSDALRKLSDRSTHLYIDGKRYWYDTKPTVSREAKDRASHVEDYQISEEIQQRLQSQRGKGDFSGIHVFPEETADVPDDLDVRLVIFDIENSHERKNSKSLALKQAQQFLEKRGQSPRIYKNTLVFLAPDSSGSELLKSSVREYLGWKSISEDNAMMESLTGHDKKTISSKMGQLDDVIAHRIKDTFVWTLVPTQPKAESKEIVWETIKINGDGSRAESASKKLVTSELLNPIFSGTRLRMLLDRYLWKDESIKHFPVKKLWEMFGTYLYFDRLKDSSVLQKSIEEGVGRLTWEECFALAEHYDEELGKYKGIKAAEFPIFNLQDSNILLVKPEAAAPQLGEKRQVLDGNIDGQPTPGNAGSSSSESEVGDKPMTQFYGLVKVNGSRIQRDIDNIISEVVTHLSAELDSTVEVTLEITARLNKGYSEKTQSIVSENANSLKFVKGTFESD
jgi:predicted AAA+ superfamily ATPase